LLRFKTDTWVMMTNLYVQFNSCEISHYRDEKEYCEWRSEYDFCVKGVSITHKKEYDEEKYSLPDIKIGDVVFVLYMIYSSGDSFGSSTGNGEILWVFKDAELGEKAKAKFEAENDSCDPKFSIEIETDEGTTFKMSNPAAGYFKNMAAVRLDTFLVSL